MDSKFDTYFRSIDKLPIQESRQNVIAFLKAHIDALRSDSDKSSEIAYVIAGHMATKFAQGLEEDDALIIVMTIAGELEVNPSNSDELRHHLIQAIEKL